MHHEKGDKMLNMTLNEIKGKITLYPENWDNTYTTNCYAYALGLDIPEFKICKGAYQPGSISMEFNPLVFDQYFNYNTLIENLENDLKMLDISYREVEPNEKIEDNEWKISVFTDNCDDERIIDFHFLRQNSDGVWFHKNGFSGKISNKDRSGKIITDVTKCYLAGYKYKKSYALKLEK